MRDLLLSNGLTLMFFLSYRFVPCGGIISRTLKVSFLLWTAMTETVLLKQGMNCIGCWMRYVSCWLIYFWDFCLFLVIIITCLECSGASCSWRETSLWCSGETFCFRFMKCMWKGTNKTPLISKSSAHIYYGSFADAF